MKRLVITGVALLAFAGSVFAQGAINVTIQSYGNTGVTLNDNATFIPEGSAFGLEVWELAAAAVPAGINLTPSVGYGIAAHDALVAAGFKLEKTVNGTVPVGYLGTFNVGAVTMTDWSATANAAGTIIAIAMWNNNSTSWAAMLAGAGADPLTRAGVKAFANPVGDLGASPPQTAAPLSGWTDVAGNELVLMAVPEPSTFALAGLGAAALLIFRRRK